MPSDGSLCLEKLPFSVGRTKSSSPWSMQKHHYHDTVELYYLFSGSRYYFIGEKSYYIKAGDLVTVAPYDMHATAATDGVEYDRLLISFKKEYLAKAGGDDALAFLKEGSRAVEFQPRERAEVESLLLGIQREYDDPEGSSVYIKSALVCLSLLLSRKRAKPTDTERISERTLLVARASALISSRFREEITLCDLARELFVSPSYLSRVFSRATGVPLTEYVNSVRIEEAKRLLLGTSRSVGEIAYAVGYSSATHFDRVFKRHNGKTPLAFRNHGG